MGLNMSEKFQKVYDKLLTEDRLEDIKFYAVNADSWFYTHGKYIFEVEESLAECKNNVKCKDKLLLELYSKVQALINDFEKE